MVAARKETGFQVRLKEAITEAGLNNNRLAQLVGVSGPYFTKLLKGVLSEQRVSTEIAKAIADFLGVNMMWLFFNQGPKRSGALLDVPQDVTPREASKAAAQFFKVPAHIVEAVQKRYASSAYDVAEKYPPMWWMHRYEKAIDREKAMYEHNQKVLKQAEAQRDEAPKSEPEAKSARGRRRRSATA